MTIDHPGAPGRSDRFSYLGFDLDEARSELRCRYQLDSTEYVETFGLPPGGTWGPAAHEAARLVYLLAGVSYYKAGAPLEIDLGTTVMRPGDREFLWDFYVDGLGEFAYRNDISLLDVQFVGGTDDDRLIPTELSTGRPLVPFGGGIDSLVSVDIATRTYGDVALFVVNRAGDPFAAIERAAKATGLPVLRVQREVDPELLRQSADGHVLNGHVPITGILSAVAVMTAVLFGRDAVIMSNEWSASRGNLTWRGRIINHQYSKSESFERRFRSSLASAFETPVSYFSLLRPRSELWVAQRFARLERFHPVVHSCNRAFHLAPDERQEQWCGQCDKCCFIDLILSPFMSRPQLEGIFDGREPLADPDLLGRFRDLVGTAATRKPFECVGDVEECRAAVVLASERDDRQPNRVLASLLEDLGDDEVRLARSAVPRLLSPIGPSWVPDELLEPAALV